MASVHLVFRRDGQGLDCLTELRVEGFGEFDVETQASRDDVLRLKLTVTTDTRTAGHKGCLEQAADEAKIDDLVHYANRDIVGVGQGYDGRLSGLGVIAHGNGLARLVTQFCSGATAPSGMGKVAA